MSLSNDALRDPTVLSKLKSEGGMLERHVELLKKHIMNGCSLNGDSLESFRLSFQVRRNGGLWEEEHAKDIDGKVTDILCHSSSVEGAGASTTPSERSAFSSKGKLLPPGQRPQRASRQLTKASPQGSGLPQTSWAATS